MTTPLTPNKPSEELREQFQRIYLAFHDGKHPFSTYINDLMAASLSHTRTAVDTAVEQAEPKIEIKAKIEALDKLILGAGEYHDDPYEYVVPLRHIQAYRAGLEKFDLDSPEPIFKEREKQLTPPPVERHPKAQE